MSAQEAEKTAAVNGNRKAVDWEAIEPHWRAGIRTKKELAEAFNVSRAAMDKHFDKLGIARDLTAKIQARAETLVAQEAVTRRLHVTEADIVEANASVQALAQVQQRKDVAKALDVVTKLLNSLDGQLDFRADLEELGELMRSEDAAATDKMNDLYRKVLSFPSHVDSSKKLIEGLRIGIELQRKVLRIKDDDQGDDSLGNGKLSDEQVSAKLASLISRAK